MPRSPGLLLGSCAHVLGRLLWEALPDRHPSSCTGPGISSGRSTCSSSVTCPSCASEGGSEQGAHHLPRPRGRCPGRMTVTVRECRYGPNCVPGSSWSDTNPQVPAFGDGAFKGVVQVNEVIGQGPARQPVSLWEERERQRSRPRGGAARGGHSPGTESAGAVALAFNTFPS